MAWTPEFIPAPAAAVIHQVDPKVILSEGPAWLADVRERLRQRGIILARIYLKKRNGRIDKLMHEAGYGRREELVFTHNLPEPPPFLTFRPVRKEEDWARKLAFHEDVPESPDGHGNDATHLVGLERHKCAHGMHAYFGEIDGKIVGVVSAVWGDGIVRVKNLVVHPNHRRQSVATTLLSHIAALGRQRGIRQQCLVALKGGGGEKLYRRIGMQLSGSQFEWSKPLAGSSSR